MPPKKRSAYTKSKGDDGEPKFGKRSKTSSAAKVTGKKFVDSEGNPYWEASRAFLSLTTLGGRLRRVTVSEFKGKHLISIREHYEKDGEFLPGKKGISLTIEQFDALLSVLPQLDSYLAGKDISLTRPVYGLAPLDNKDEEEQEQEDEGKDDEMIDETREEEQEEEEDEVRPEKKPAKVAKATQTKLKKKAVAVESDEE